MAQMEVYDILKNHLLSGKNSGLSLIVLSDKVIEGNKKGIYCGSFDVGVLHMDCKRLCALGLVKKKFVDGRVTYRLNKKVLEE